MHLSISATVQNFVQKLRYGAPDYFAAEGILEKTSHENYLENVGCHGVGRKGSVWQACSFGEHAVANHEITFRLRQQTAAEKILVELPLYVSG